MQRQSHVPTPQTGLSHPFLEGVLQRQVKPWGSERRFPALANQRHCGDNVHISPRVTKNWGLLGYRQALLPREWAAVVSELKKRPRPRSPSLTTPVAVMNTLAGLMSAGEEERGWCGTERRRKSGWAEGWALQVIGRGPVLLRLMLTHSENSC